MEENEQEDDVQAQELAAKRRRLYFHRVDPSRNSLSRRKDASKVNTERLSETVRTLLLQRISSNQQQNAETEGSEASCKSFDFFCIAAPSIAIV